MFTVVTYEALHQTEPQIWPISVQATPLKSPLQPLPPDSRRGDQLGNYHRIGDANLSFTIWQTYKKLWEITMFNGKIYYKWPCSIAILVYQRVSFVLDP
jgi:hypothetical protein